MDQHPDSDMDGSASNNEEEELSEQELMGEEGDEDSMTGEENLISARLPASDPDLLLKIKQQVREQQEREELIEREMKAAHKELQARHLQDLVCNNPPPPSSLVAPRARDPMLSLAAASMVPPPVPMFSHPSVSHQHAAAMAAAAAFPATAALQNSISSASSHSSESSNSSQQTWSFEEQFKQVRQLYELSDDPKRKDFLDDLFSFMQKRGTPINRLPIMAKQVLDLFELYNLVIARGGLVDVINKKLWQEIIKGLHLPSSITSAAFTLRTQYMKYLYPYECEKRQLSSPNELQAAIDGNRREGRRSSYGTYAEMVQRSPGLGPALGPLGVTATSLAQQMSPLSLVTASRPLTMNGNGMHHPPQHPLSMPPGNCMNPGELEARMADYVKLLDKELRRAATTSPSARQGSSSPPISTSPREQALNALEMSRLTLWNLYHNAGAIPGDEARAPPPTPPQREALNLEISRQQAAAEQARALEAIVKKEMAENNGPAPAKRPHMLDEETALRLHAASVPGAHIKINSRGDARGDNSSLVVSMEINGVMYQGVLFAQVSPPPPRVASRLS